MFDMAIFKATYTKISAGAKANIRYIQNRRGKDNAKISRTLFGIDGNMERREAYRMIDESGKGSVFYRLVINFDAEKEDTHKDLYIQTITENTMSAVENRFGQPVQWVAATHADHTPLRHVHILAILPKKLQVHDLQAIRSLATEAAVTQRHQRDKVVEIQRREQQEKETVQWRLPRRLNGNSSLLCGVLTHSCIDHGFPEKTT